MADNPTAKEITEKISAINSFEALYRFIPFTKKLFPKLFYRYHLCIQLIIKKLWRRIITPMNRYWLWIQPIDAIHILNRSAGVSKFYVFLGNLAEWST